MKFAQEFRKALEQEGEPFRPLVCRARRYADNNTSQLSPRDGLIAPSLTANSRSA